MLREKSHYDIYSVFRTGGVLSMYRRDFLTSSKLLRRALCSEVTTTTAAAGEGGVRGQVLAVD